MTALAYFGPQFFETLVGGGSQDLLITGLYGAEKFVMVGTYILFFSERWGRRPTLWISPILMACCFVIVNVVNKTTPPPVNENPTSAGIATVAMVFITNSIYQFSWVLWFGLIQQRSFHLGFAKLGLVWPSAHNGSSTLCFRSQRLI